jgi:hypothetical protein
VFEVPVRRENGSLRGKRRGNVRLLEVEGETWEERGSWRERGNVGRF